MGKYGDFFGEKICEFKGKEQENIKENRSFVMENN